MKRLGRAFLPAALLLSLLPAAAAAQGWYSPAGYALSGGRGTLLRDIDGAMVSPALLGLPGRRAFSIRLLGVSAHVDQNLMSLGRWNAWQGAFLTEADKLELLASAGDAARVAGLAEMDLIGLQVGSFAFGTYLFASTEGRIPSAFLEIALMGTDVDRTYQLEEIGVRTEVVSVFQASYAFKMRLLENLAANLPLPIEHINAGVALKYYLGHGYAGDGEGRADIWLGRYGMTGAADYTYRTAGIPGGLLQEDSDIASVVADSTFGNRAGSGLGLDLGVAMQLSGGFSFHGALLNLSPGITWSRSTYELHVTASADSLSIGDFIEVGSQEAADIDSLTAHDLTFEPIGSFRTAVPLLLRLGGTYRLGRLAVNAEFEQALTRAWGYNLVPRLSLGLEFRPLGFFPLRAGMTLGGRFGAAGAVGLGLDFRALVFDVAVGNTGLTPGGVRGLGVSTGLKVSW